ncbi:hypothetical protein QUA82_33835 [Microcoleus sp. F8-D3]
MLSTFPPDGKKVPAANLNFAFQWHFGNPTSPSGKNPGAPSRHRLRSPRQLRRTLQSDFAAAQHGTETANNSCEFGNAFKRR